MGLFRLQNLFNSFIILCWIIPGKNISLGRWFYRLYVSILLQRLSCWCHCGLRWESVFEHRVSSYFLGFVQVPLSWCLWFGFEDVRFGWAMWADRHAISTGAWWMVTFRERLSKIITLCLIKSFQTISKDYYTNKLVTISVGFQFVFCRILSCGPQAVVSARVWLLTATVCVEFGITTV